MKKPNKEKNILRFIQAAVGSGQLVYSTHATSRMREREIIKPEVEYVLKNGFHEARKDQFNAEFSGWDYAIRGKTVDERSLRIVIAVVRPNVLIVTAIDLDKED